MQKVNYRVMALLRRQTRDKRQPWVSDSGVLAPALSQRDRGRRQSYWYSVTVMGKSVP